MARHSAKLGSGIRECVIDSSQIGAGRSAFRAYLSGAQHGIRTTHLPPPLARRDRGRGPGRGSRSRVIALA